MPAKSFPLAIILAGGLGTRLRRVLPNLPKALAPVAGRPFLEWVLRYLRSQGVRRAVLSAGYLGNQLDQYARGLRIPGLEVTCVREPALLGTAGAVIHVLVEIGSVAGDVLVCNGDSLALGNLSPLIHALAEPMNDGALLAVPVADAVHYGALDVDADGTLRGFSEKRGGSGLVNAGVYLLRSTMVARFPNAAPLSFEYDVFPSLIGQGVRIKVIPCDCPFLDIGREVSLRQADGFVEAHMEWFQ